MNFIERLKALLAMTINRGFFKLLEKFLSDLSKLSPEEYKKLGKDFRALMDDLCVKLDGKWPDEYTMPDLRKLIAQYCSCSVSDDGQGSDDGSKGDEGKQNNHVPAKSKINMGRMKPNK